MPDEQIGTPAEGAPAPESTTSTPDYGPVMDRLTELAGTVGELQSGFQQFTQAQAPAQEETDPWASLWGEQQPDPNLAPEPQQPQLDPAALQNAIQHAIQQANAPLTQQLQQLQTDRAREQLYQELPQLREPETAQRTQEYMNKFLAANNVPPQVADWLVNSPAFIAQNFKAAEAENAARAQVPAGGEIPSLEAAGGAHPGGTGESQSPIDQIYGTRQAEIPKGFR
jgi:hypothetical protein